jgi:hypothetical protein
MARTYAIRFPLWSDIELKRRNERSFCGLKPQKGSLDGTCRALVDASSTLCADIRVDDCNIADCDGGRGASICTCSACDAICFDYFRHLNNLEIP